jgi:gluconolactonase
LSTLIEPERRFVSLTIVPKRLFALCGGLVSIALFFLVLGAQGAIFDTIQLPDEFNKIVDTNISALTTNAYTTVGGTDTILEGPCWIPGEGANGYLIFSAFRNNSTYDTNGRLMKLILPNTLVSNYFVPPMGTVYNGSTLDMQERYVACQSGSNGLRVVMITNNVVTTLVNSCGGSNFYSPNDVVVKSDGTLWFTDPQFNSGYSDGRAGFVTGHNVYRCNPTNGNASCAIVISLPNSTNRPNGICFSPDESILYLAAYESRSIRAYSVSPSNTLSGATNCIVLPTGKGNPDGIRCDADGRIYVTANNGVYVYMPYPDYRLIGHIVSPKGVANLCFGGHNRCTLFMTASPYVFSVPLKVTGAVWKRNVSVSSAEDDSVRVSWPAPSTGFQLQGNSELGAGTWTAISNTPSVSNGQNVLQFSPTNPAMYFRLQVTP